MRWSAASTSKGLGALSGFALFVLPGSAQITSNAPAVTLTAVLAESISITVPTTQVNFALTQAGTVAGSAGVSVTTNWLLGIGRANVVLDAYFASASAALTLTGAPNGTTPAVIPASAVLGEMTTGTPTSFTAFTGTAALGPAGSGLTLYTQPLSATNRFGTRTDTLLLEINLSGLPQLPAGTYTGTLTLQAEAL